MLRSPYISNAPTVSTIMLKVVIALIPAIIAYVWVFGGGILLSLLLATVTSLGAEALMLKIRERPIMPFLLDGSALVTAWLLALSLPPLAPWWLVVMGSLFAIVIAKHLYGGLGYNPFNPAMIGYAALLISFPAIMTQWPAPIELAQAKLDFFGQWQLILSGALPNGMKLDAITQATPLDYLKTQLLLNQSTQTILSAPIYGQLAGRGTEFIALAYLLGGVYLMQQNIISWHLPVAFLAGLASISAIFYLVNPDHFANPLLHLLGGASMLAAFFIITDPVSGPTTPNGKLVFAVGIALLTYLIRVFGGYPDGVAFAVIIFNICVPLIDILTQPRVFGR